MKTWQSFSLSMAIALSWLAGGTGDRAWANYNVSRCQQVREVRALALQAGLDGANLAALEVLYCQRSQPSRRSIRHQVSRDCQTLTAIAQLARIEQGTSALTRAVVGQQQVACNLGENSRLDRRLSYPNGQAVRFGDNWQYPNGQQAFFGATWNYPSGTRARFGSSWQYPNGSTARFGSNWRYPDGTLTSEQQLLTWACAIVPADECNQRLSEIRTRSGDTRDLAILELAWRAYQIGGAPT
ncbi:MAG: hypothetical protein HC910_22015 [Spirulinaceae cyanobacterium SM2_1_0]|nr:hypothetical protein [Spirulinaceae cyanobacterium SM2_1_0]